MLKVKVVNLEFGQPTVEEALRNMLNSLSTAKKSGFRALILVHGYGSNGVGGSIKSHVRRQLADRSLCGLVRDYVAGEDWLLRKRDFLNICGGLKDFEREIAGNLGVTVVLLK